MKKLRLLDGSVWEFNKNYASEHEILQIEPKGYPALPLRLAQERGGIRFAVDLLGRIWIGEGKALTSPCKRYCMDFIKGHSFESVGEIDQAWEQGFILDNFLETRGLKLKDLTSQVPMKDIVANPVSEQTFEKDEP